MARALSFPHVTLQTQWCPPCKELAPKFRQASNDLQLFKFGAVDCTAEDALCLRFGIGHYPTVRLYIDGKMLEMPGIPKDVVDFKEFIEDYKNPPVEELSPESFTSKVTVAVLRHLSPFCVISVRRA